MRNRAWLLAVLAVCGCTTHLRPTEIAPQPGARPPLAVDGPVAVRAAAVDPEPHRFSLGSGFSARVHYADYTQAAVRLIAAELARQGVRVGEGGRSLDIAVQYVTYVHRAGDSACVIDFAVGMGDGRKRGIQTQGRAWTIGGACDEALTNMVTETLGNPWVVRYLTRRQEGGLRAHPEGVPEISRWLRPKADTIWHPSGVRLRMTCVDRWYRPSASTTG